MKIFLIFQEQFLRGPTKGFTQFYQSFYGNISKLYLCSNRKYASEIKVHPVRLSGIFFLYQSDNIPSEQIYMTAETFFTEDYFQTTLVFLICFCHSVSSVFFAVAYQNLQVVLFRQVEMFLWRDT